MQKHRSGRTPPPRLGTGASLAALLGIGLALGSGFLLRNELANAPIYAASQRPSIAIASPQVAGCVPALVDAQVTIAGRQPGQPDLGQALVTALRCFPSNGSWWTQLAWDRVHKGNFEGFDRFFANAETTSPAEGPLMRIRLDLLAATRDDAEWAEPAVQERYRTYMSQANRRQLTDLFDVTSLSRRPELMALVHSLDGYEIELWLKSSDAARFAPKASR